jgi:hypothetical protein
MDGSWLHGPSSQLTEVEESRRSTCIPVSKGDGRARGG